MKEECQAVNVAAVDCIKAQRQLSDELRKDHKKICMDFDILPLKLYMDALVNHFKNEYFWSRWLELAIDSDNGMASWTYMYQL